MRIVHAGSWKLRVPAEDLGHTEYWIEAPAMTVGELQLIVLLFVVIAISGGINEIIVGKLARRSH